MRGIWAIALALVCTHSAAKTEVGVVVELPDRYKRSFTFADRATLPGDAAAAIADALGKRLGYLTFLPDVSAPTRLRFRLAKADDVGPGQHEYGFHVTLENDSTTTDPEYLLFRGADRYGDSLGSAAAFVAEMHDVAHSPAELCMSRESSLRFLNVYKQGDHSRESLADAHVEYYDGQILGLRRVLRRPFRRASIRRESGSTAPG